MREQVASPFFPPPLERKKSGVKISGRDEINDQRKRLNESYANDFGGKSIVNIPGVRLKGVSSVNHSKDQDLDDAGLEKTEKTNHLEKTEKTNHLEKVERPNGLERIEKPREDEELEDGHKRRVLDDDLFFQWGHRKRPRGTRLEAKHIESSPLSEKTAREDRRFQKPERQLIAPPFLATVQSKAQTSRLGDPDACENGLIMGKRNGQNFSSSSKWASTTNAKDCASNDVRRVPSNAMERSDRHTSFSPDKNDRASVCPWSTDEASPDDGFRVSIQNGESGNIFPPTLQKVDLELFEWPRILISLSRKEKEDDFMAIKGSKLPHRPKRRPKVVEKALHYCSPGTWLGDLTRGRYDVREKKSMKKKPRGLKAMESSDSLSA
eukprot:c28515_g1_i3 orf=202-1341(+)